MEKTAKALQRARYCSEIQNEPVICRFEVEDREIAPFWVSVPATGAPAVSKVERDPPVMEEAHHLPNLELRMSLKMILILKERQQQSGHCRRS